MIRLFDKHTVRRQRYEGLYARYFGKVYRQFFAASGCEKTAEQMASDVFVKLYRVLEELPSEQIAERWIQMTADEYQKKIK